MTNQPHKPPLFQLTPQRVDAVTGKDSVALGACRLAGGHRPLESSLGHKGIEVTFRDYGEGLVEASWHQGRASGGGVKGEGLDREANEARAVSRSRKVVRRRCMANKLDYLLTLTYRENVQDRKRAIADLYAFVGIVTGKLPGWRWVAVAERQERGAFHWHIAVSGWQNVEMLRDAWRQVVGEGNIDVKAPRTSRGGYRFGLAQLAYYLVKYMTKGGERALNEKRYFSSGEGDVVVVKITVLSPGLILDIIEELIGKVRSKWFSGSIGWVATWDMKGNLG